MATLIGNEMIVMFDVDDTLVMWANHNHWLPKPGKYEFVDPYDQTTVYLYPHKAHIALLKKYKAQGYTVFVWSAGGGLWAQEVVNVLQLNDHVDFIMSKPLKYVDDLQAKEVLGSRVYIVYGKPEKDFIPGEPE